MKSKTQSSRVEIKKTFEIESARFLPYLPKDHPCSRTHGHSFKITLCLQGPLDKKIGWLIDYAEITKIADPIMSQIDHAVLNNIPGLSNPTTENLTIWLYKQLRKKLPHLVQVIISETKDTECRYPI